jgi:hypothetical protein
LELDELAKGHARAALFASKDSEMFPAQRSREQFERFFVPIFTAVLCIGQAAAAFFLWRSLSQPDVSVALKQPMVPMFVFGIVFFLSLFLLGRFSATMRPAWRTIACASHCRLHAFERMALPGCSCRHRLCCWWLCERIFVARGLCVFACAHSGIETLIALLLEMYRPAGQRQN